MRAERTGRPGSEEAARGAVARRQAEVLVGAPGGHAAARRALQEALLDEVGLVKVLERAGILPHPRGQALQPGRAAVVVGDQRAEELAVHVLEAVLVHLEILQRLA